MTLDEQIQETIVKYLDYYAPDHKDCECSNCLYSIHELKKELIALIANQVREAVKEEKSIRAKLVTKAHKDGIADGLQMALYGVKNGSKEEKFIRHLLYSENIGDKELVNDQL